jgi:hypothetical protein
VPLPLLFVKAESSQDCRALLLLNSPGAPASLNRLHEIALALNSFHEIALALAARSILYSLCICNNIILVTIMTIEIKIVC